MNKITTLLIIGVLLTSCVSKQNPIAEIEFNKDVENESLCDLTFPNPKTNSELIELNEEYKLDELVSNAKSDIEKAMILLNWTHSRWTHNGDNKPKKNNALNILKEAKEGKNFRCVEYGTVLSATLNSNGIPARVLGLKTKEIETTKSGAGHVATEAYIPELKKWIFLDPQINYIPFLNGTPLNAVEYQNAIIHHRTEIKLRNLNGKFNQRKALSKINWVSKYLFYFDTRFDISKKKMKCNGKSKLMLVPIGEKKPKIFQIKYKIDNCIYTNNIKDFYKKPKTVNNDG